jgi:tetratricopeptide (TPR) repeat protein
MSNLAKLKKKAADFELKKQFDRALAVYVEILDKHDDGSEEVDVALFNRVGDLLLRQGNVADAVDYYERAIDKYADGGFFNNAIALCNKVLRNSPGRASVYYKLGKISAQKGFKSDAKKNFLEYADRMQQAGNIDEAFRSLKEFADLCPDQDDIRLMLADQLSRKERPAEALEQLEILYARYLGEGREGEAKATLERMKGIDPAFEPQATGASRSQASQDLVFLDLSDDAPRRSSGAQQAIRDVPPAAPPIAPPEPPALLPELEQAPDLELTGIGGSSALEGLEPTTFDTSSPASPGEPAPMMDLEPTSLDFIDTAPASSSAPPTPPMGIPGLEQTPPMGVPGVGRTPAGGAHEVGLTPPAGMAGVQPPDAIGGLPLLDDGVVAPSEETPVLDFLVPPSEVAEDDSPASDLDLILPGDDLPPPQRRSSAELLAEMDPPLMRESSAPPADVGSLDLDPALGAWEMEPDPRLADTGPQDTISLDAPETMGLDEGLASGAADLPLMDLEVPQPRPTLDEDSIRKSRALPELTINEDLDSMLEEASATEAEAEPVNEADAVGEEVVAEEPPPIERTRRSTMIAAQSVEMLRTMVEDEPDPGLRRRLGEAMLDSGDREGGMKELEEAMLGYEQAGDLNSAASVADEIGRVAPESVRIHQKRVEYAFRINDKDRLCAAYLDLADSLRESGQDDKARTVYQRVLELRPDEFRAQAALESLAPPQAEPEPAQAAPQKSAAAPAPTGSDDFINLGDMLREDEGPKTTRFTVDEHQPSGDEEADFAEMLRKFKQGVAENVEEEDHQSHYDLGVAFKEMGLLDEAIAEFQKALRAPSNRLPTYEALGQCFVEKEQYAVASAILSRALAEAGYTDEQLVGVLYLLGRAAEGSGAREKAVEFYQRVFMVDIQFQDVAERLAAVEQVKA